MVVVVVVAAAAAVAAVAVAVVVVVVVVVVAVVAVVVAANSVAVGWLCCTDCNPVCQPREDNSSNRIKQQQHQQQ